MKNRFLLTFIVTILSINITSAKVTNNITNDGDEEVKVLYLEYKKKPYNSRIIRTGDRLNVKKEDGTELEGYLGKITNEDVVVIIDKKGLIVGEAQLSKIAKIRYEGYSYMIDGERFYDLKIKTRIITGKSKRRKNFWKKTAWTILGIAGMSLSFKYFVLRERQ